MRYQTAGVALAVCVLAIGVASMPQGALADCSGSVSRPIELGVSGGNIHSFNKKKRLCFSGTLGSMVQDNNGKQFILSNNHVLDDTNKAKHGDLIVQPGLADVQCVQTQSDAVAKRGVRIFRQEGARLLCYIIRVIVAAPDADAGSMPAPTGGGRPTP